MKFRNNVKRTVQGNRQPNPALPPNVIKTFAGHKNINRNNYKKIDELIDEERENIKNYEVDLSEERKKLKETADTLSFVEKVLGGTYVQSLVEQEDYRVTSDYIPRGVSDLHCSDTAFYTEAAYELGFKDGARMMLEIVK